MAFMIYTKKQIWDLLSKPLLQDGEVIEILRYYIHLRKNRVVEIARPQWGNRGPMMNLLMSKMYTAAVDWMVWTGHFDDLEEVATN